MIKVDFLDVPELEPISTLAGKTISPHPELVLISDFTSLDDAADLDLDRESNALQLGSSLAEWAWSKRCAVAVAVRKPTKLHPVFASFFDRVVDFTTGPDGMRVTATIKDREGRVIETLSLWVQSEFGTLGGGPAPDDDKIDRMATEAQTQPQHSNMVIIARRKKPK